MLFGKRLQELTADDIQRLVDEAVVEDAQLEFKGSLPTRKGRKDTWLSDKANVSEYARDKILQEVVAFANAYGGTVVIGIEETKEKPPRAKAVSPLPMCNDLAERLLRQCGTGIDPKIPLLDAVGVSIGEDDQGVVVIHIPKSPMAPHRHVYNRQCYFRRSSSSEPMSMREIQDLTLQIERGIAGLEKRFEDRRKKFETRVNRFVDSIDSTDGGLALRATLQPISPLFVENVYKIEALKAQDRQYWATINDQEPFELLRGTETLFWRPILRGALGTDQAGSNGVVYREIHWGGLIECGLIRNQMYDSRLAPVYPSWVMDFVANALLAVERFRRVAEAPDHEYGMELEIRALNVDLPVTVYGRDMFSRSIGTLSVQQDIFPLYAVGGANDFVEIAAMIEKDFWNAVGNDSTDKVLKIDFQPALDALA